MFGERRASPSNGISKSAFCFSAPCARDIYALCCWQVPSQSNAPDLTTSSSIKSDVIMRSPRLRQGAQEKAGKSDELAAHQGYCCRVLVFQMRWRDCACHWRDSGEFIRLVLLAAVLHKNGRSAGQPHLQLPSACMLDLASGAAYEWPVSAVAALRSATGNKASATPRPSPLSLSPHFAK